MYIGVEDEMEKEKCYKHPSREATHYRDSWFTNNPPVFVCNECAEDLKDCGLEYTLNLTKILKESK